EERRELAGAGEQQFERSRREEKKRVAARTGRGRRGLQRPELVALDPGRSSTASCSTGPGSRHRCRVSSLTVGSFASPLVSAVSRSPCSSASTRVALRRKYMASSSTDSRL